MRNTDRNLSPEAQLSLRTLNKNLPWKMKLQEIIKLLGHVEDESCLEIGANNGAVSHYLRRRGGNWHTVVTDEKAKEMVVSVVPENVHLMKEDALPFKKQMFDVVIIVDLLEVAQSDSDFIEECHRVLKPEGRLIICAARAKSFSFINTLRRMLDLTTGLGSIYAGYSEPEMFTLLKHGFDVHTVRTFSRFCVEFVDSFVRFMVRGVDLRDSNADRRLLRFYSVANIFYVLAFQLDLLLLFSKGHHIIATAKRRAWRTRNAPVLIDGRTISEAVLSPLK